MEEASSPALSSRMGESARSDIVVGRGAPAIPPHSSAATAGSGCESMEGVDDEDDDDTSSDEMPYIHKNDSDEYMDDFGPDDESLEGTEDTLIHDLKRTRKEPEVQRVLLTPSQH